jgi:molecular chaperone GrpE (heat shock protein)
MKAQDYENHIEVCSHFSTDNLAELLARKEAPEYEDEASEENEEQNIEFYKNECEEDEESELSEYADNPNIFKRKEDIDQDSKDFYNMFYHN